MGSVGSAMVHDDAENRSPRQVKVSPQQAGGDIAHFSEVSKKRERSLLNAEESPPPQFGCGTEGSSPGMAPKAPKYEVADPANSKTAELATPMSQLTHEYWHNAIHRREGNQPECDPSTPRSELSSPGSSDSGEEYCIPGREESMSCGLVLLRENPRLFSKTFIYVEHELKVKRTKLYLLPTQVDVVQKQKVRKVRPIHVFRLSNIDNVVVKKKDHGYSTISLTLSPHCEHKKIVLAVDTTESAGALEWVNTLSTAVELEQIRAAQVKQNFRERLHQQSEAWQKDARRGSRGLVHVVAASATIAQAWHARAQSKKIKVETKTESPRASLGLLQNTAATAHAKREPSAASHR